MRLIDVDALDKKLRALVERYVEQGRFEVAKDYSFVQTVLLTAPTIYAEPVTHQKWESRVVMGAEVWECSGCKTMGNPQWKRCPVCEAKMDGEKNE